MDKSLNVADEVGIHIQLSRYLFFPKSLFQPVENQVQSLVGQTHSSLIGNSRYKIRRGRLINNLLGYSQIFGQFPYLGLI